MGKFRITVLASCLALACGLGPAGPEAAQAQQMSATTPLSEEELTKALLGNAQERLASADYVIAHPDAVNPIYLSAVVTTLWQRGDRAQATFWFYIFQSRSRAWADSSSNLAELRAALNDQMGQTINGWAASDFTAWHDIAGRAIAYEQKIPLYKGVPTGYSAEKWAASVAQRRKDYEDGFTRVFANQGADLAARDAERRRNGLSVGPLQDPGKPLPDDWR